MKWNRLACWTFFALLVIFIALKGFSNYLGASNFGKATVTLSDGSKVYVIHEQWGLHEDRIFITQNSDGCLPANPQTDYIDEYGDGRKIVYAVTNDGLDLYEDLHQPPAVTVHVPTNQWDHKIINVKRGPLSAMAQTPKEYGVIVLNVPLNERCLKNFFRNAGTSLNHR